MKNLSRHLMETENSQTQKLGEKKMKAKKLILGLVALSILSFAASASAEVPQMINYQGTLTDTTGCPLSGNYTLVFRIYDAPTDGNLLWDETHDAVAVTQGNFNVLLGSTDSIPNSIFLSDSLWLAVKVGNDPEMTPRQRIASVGYAFRSEFADTAEYARKALLPSGVIVMWSGAIDDIPEGWALCDGTNGTPDLTDRFVKSVPNSLTDPGSTGGAATHNHGGETGSHTLTIAEMPAHNHSGTFGRYCQVGDPPNIAAYGNSAVNPYPVAVPSQGGGEGHTHTITSDSSLPPYYELAFIMKL